MAAGDQRGRARTSCDAFIKDRYEKYQLCLRLHKPSLCVLSPVNEDMVTWMVFSLEMAMLFCAERVTQMVC